MCCWLLDRVQGHFDIVGRFRIVGLFFPGKGIKMLNRLRDNACYMWIFTSACLVFLGTPPGQIGGILGCYIASVVCIAYLAHNSKGIVRLLFVVTLVSMFAFAAFLYAAYATDHRQQFRFLYTVAALVMLVSGVSALGISKALADEAATETANV